MTKSAGAQQRSSEQTGQASPALFFETINSYQRSEALKAAIELDVFTAIAERADSVEALARRCGAAARGIRILCDYLVVIGFLTKQLDRYGLTIDSGAFLNRKSPSYLGATVGFLGSSMVIDSFKDLAAAVRRGGSVSDAATISPDHPIWVEFARSMSPMMALPAELIAKLIEADRGQKWKVLDIAAGHGLFGISIAKHNPNAEVVAVDWPNVLEVAKENAQAAGVANRYSLISGNAFEVDYGSGYDLALLTNFLHHFDAPSCEKLLRRVHASLKNGGRAVTLEFIPNDDRVSPPVPATFSLIMLGMTPSGDAYTFPELQRIFRNAGFSSNELHDLPPTFQRVVVSSK